MTDIVAIIQYIFYALRLQFYPEMGSKPLPTRATELESDVAQCEPAAVPDLDDSAILQIQQQTEGDKPHTVTQQPTGKQSTTLIITLY